MRRLVLLDRDGTINVERRYLSLPDQVQLLPAAAEGIRRMRRLGLTPVVVTNQSAIGRGYFDFDTLNRIHRRLAQLLARRGAILDAFFVCPHRPDDACNCRKPAPGLALQAASRFQAELAGSFVVGDKPCDIELGARIQATTFLVRTGYGAQVAEDPSHGADYVANDLLEVAHLIGHSLAVDADSSLIGLAKRG